MQVLKFLDLRNPLILLSTINQELVTIRVGENEECKSFIVYKQMLVNVSPYFRAAFTGEKWEEAKSRELALADANPSVFAAFLDWVYSRCLPELWPPDPECISCKGACGRVVQAGKELDFEHLNEDETQELESTMHFASPLVDLYIFTDRFEVPQLRETIVNHAWHDILHSKICIQILLWACDQLPDHSCLFRLMADTLICNFKIEFIRCKYTQALCQRVASTLWIQVLGGATRSEGRPRLKFLCGYHEHKWNAIAVTECKSGLSGDMAHANRQHAIAKQVLESVAQGVAKCTPNA